MCECTVPRESWDFPQDAVLTAPPLSARQLLSPTTSHGSLPLPRPRVEPHCAIWGRAKETGEKLSQILPGVTFVITSLMRPCSVPNCRVASGSGAVSIRRRRTRHPAPRHQRRSLSVRMPCPDLPRPAPLAAQEINLARSDQSCGRALRPSPNQSATQPQSFTP